MYAMQSSELMCYSSCVNLWQSDEENHVILQWLLTATTMFLVDKNCLAHFSCRSFPSMICARSCSQNAFLWLRSWFEAMWLFEMWAYEGFYNFSKVCLQFFSFLNVVFSRLFYDNITFQHLFIIIKCPTELNFDCKILIRSVPSTFVTELLLRGYVFLTSFFSETNNNALSNLSYNGY